jgi:RNA-directed DNA polymerase
MPEQSGRVSVAHGEAVGDLISDEASDPPREHPSTGSAKMKASPGGLLEAALTRENLQAAWKRVKANKGAAGVDGLECEQHEGRAAGDGLAQEVVRRDPASD